MNEPENGSPTDAIQSGAIHSGRNFPDHEESPKGVVYRGALVRPSFLISVVALVAGIALIAGIAVPASPGAGTPRPMLELPVTAMNQGAGLANNSPMLAADPTEPRFVALANRLDAPDFGCALHLSGDGGRTWVPASPVPTLPRAADKCYGPEVAFGPKGVLYFLFVGLSGPGNEPMGAFIATSLDRGRTFSPPRRALGPLNFAVRMAVDRRGRLHLVWLHATSDPGVGAFGPPPNPILAAHSDDGGRTFSNPTQVSDGRRRVVAPALYVGPGPRVQVAYYDLKDDARDYQNLAGPVWDGTWAVVLATSKDRGSRFSSTEVVDDAIVPPERPILIFTMAPPALVAYGDRTCVAWTDARHGDADVLLRCSAGNAFEAAKRVNDDRIGSGHRQYMPRLSAAPGGRIDIVFWDRRRDPRNRANDVFLASSLDGGRMFARNLRITSAASDSRIGPQYVGPAAEGQFELGSRLGLLSRRDDAVAAWADTRNTRAPGPGHDVFATAIENMPRRARRPWWPRGVGVALLAAGGGSLALVRRRRSTAP